MRPRGVGGLRRAFVGRDEEMEVLERAYAEIEDRREPQLVTILGDAGVGKTRIVREFWEGLGDRSPETLRRTGRCLCYGQGITDWPLAEVVKEHIGVVESDRAARVPRTATRVGRPDPCQDVGTRGALLGGRGTDARRAARRDVAVGAARGRRPTCGGKPVLRRGTARNADRPAVARTAERVVALGGAAFGLRHSGHRAGGRRGPGRPARTGRETSLAGCIRDRPDLLGRPHLRPRSGRRPGSADPRGTRLHPTPARLHGPGG